MPLLLYAVMLQTFWARGDLGIDLTQTLLPAAREIADGNSPYPAYGYPPLVAFALVPLTLVPWPELVWTGVLAAALVASLWVLRIRDWRCYGAAFLWGASFHAIQTGNVTIPLLLLTSLAWRARELPVRAGAWAGLAVATKIICWPLAVWLVSTRRLRAAVTSVVVAGGVTAVLWGSLGFSGLLGYPSSLGKLQTAQQGSSYTVRALLEDLGAPGLGRLAWYALVLAVLAGCVIAGRRGDDRLSFSFAVLAAIVASPIVWLHSFVLLLAPVALYRPRLRDRVGRPGAALVRLGNRQRRHVADRPRARRRRPDLRAHRAPRAPPRSPWARGGRRLSRRLATPVRHSAVGRRPTVAGVEPGRPARSGRQRPTRARHCRGSRVSLPVLRARRVARLGRGSSTV